MSQISKEVWINIGRLESIRKLFLSNLWEFFGKISGKSISIGGGRKVNPEFFQGKRGFLFGKRPGPRTIFVWEGADENPKTAAPTMDGQ